MQKTCTGCVVSAGTHKPAEAVHQIDEPQAEALRIADECEESATHWVNEIDTRAKAAKLLRAQHARIAELEAQLEAIGAGGVEPLRKPAAAPQAVQAAVPTIAELEASAELGALRDVYEMARGVLRFDGIDMERALKYKDGLIEAIETVKTIDGGTWEPEHPAEGVPPQASEWDGKLPERLQSVLNALRLELPAAVVNDVEFEVRSHYEAMHTSLSTSRRMYGAARDRLEAIDAAQPDPFAATQPAAQGMDAIRALIAQHSNELERNHYAYFELAYTRRTGWMVWITDKPAFRESVLVNPDRKVLARGQGDTPEAACTAAIASQANHGEQQCTSARES